KAGGGTCALQDVGVERGWRLEQLVGRSVEVHSCHHQSPDAIGRGLLVTARAADGVVEGVELEGEPFCVGVLWHPEEHAELGGPLFHGLVEASAREPV